MNELTLNVSESLTALLTGTSPLTSKEVPTAVRAFHATGFISRQILLALFERKAHEALRQTWEEFCAEHLDMTDNNYCYQLLRWARVEKSVFGHSIIDASIMAKLPHKVAMQLAKLPDTEQPDAWKEVKTLESYGTHLPKDVARALRDIVARRLKKSGSPQETVDEHKEDEPEVPAVIPATPFVPDLRAAKPPVIVETSEAGADDLADKAPESKPVYNVRPPQDVQLPFCEAIFELRYVRIDCKLPNGNPAFVLVPRGCLK